MAVQKQLNQQEEKQKPEGHVRCGSVKVTAWKNTAKNQQGEEYERYNFQVERSYLDRKTNKWETTNSFTGAQLSDLATAVNAARQKFLVSE